MTTEKKFRAWDIDIKKMIYFTEGSEYNLLLEDGSFTVEGRDRILYQVDSIDTKYHDSFILIQYAGLKDKNRVEIYEGDIVNRFEKHSEAQPIKLQVYWNEKSCGWSIKDNKNSMYMSNLCLLEVIGNIYKNPELLK